MDDRRRKRKNHLRLPAELIMRRKDSFLSTYMPGFSFSIFRAGSGCIPFALCCVPVHCFVPSDIRQEFREAPLNHPIRHTVFGA